MQRNINPLAPPVKAGAGAHNRIGTLAEQLRRTCQPRSKARPESRSDRRIEALKDRVAELERLVALLLIRTSQRGSG